MQITSLLHIVLVFLLVSCTSKYQPASEIELARMAEADLMDLSEATAIFLKQTGKMPENISALKSIKNMDWFEDAYRKCRNTYGFASFNERWAFISLGADLRATSGDEIIVFGGNGSGKLRDVKLERAAALSVKCVPF